MKDRLVEAISHGVFDRTNISFDAIREYAKRDLGLREVLDYGRAVLDSPDELDQYLYTYGKMTKEKWDHLFDGVSFSPRAVQINDYGCGQGLASSIFLDHFGDPLLRSVSRIVLVEPSASALIRASAILSCYGDHFEVTTLHKDIDALCSEEIAGKKDVCVYHIFSEVLDIDGFNHIELFSKIFDHAGHHVVLAVSHDRDFKGGSLRFQQLGRAVNDPLYSDWLALGRSEIETFGLRGNRRGISWFLEAEVRSGSVR